MTIRQLQQRICDALNGLETLIQGSCKAIPENSLDVLAAVTTQLAQVGGVAAVVITPKLRRSGSILANGSLAVDATVKINFTEVVASNRGDPTHLTALDAAVIASLALDTDSFGFVDIEQFADDRTGTLTATATFEISFQLTSHPPQTS